MSHTERLDGFTNGDFVSWIAPKFFFPLFRKVRHEYPGLEIDLKEMAPLDQIQALANDRLHLGFAKFLVSHAPRARSHFNDNTPAPSRVFCQFMCPSDLRKGNWLGDFESRPSRLKGAIQIPGGQDLCVLRKIVAPREEHANILEHHLL
jgi:hypothetical protein